MNSPDKITDWLLVALNFFLVGSTLLLWRANNRSAGIAERALIELERPFVGIRVTNTGFTVMDAKTDEPSVLMPSGPHFQFDFFNYGRTPATITEIFDKFVVCKPGDMPDRIDPNAPGEKVPFGEIIGADGASNPSNRSQSAGIDHNEWLTFSVGDSNLFMLGFVRFRDIFDKRHITLFCLKFSKRDNRFYFDGDERYNSTRQET